MILQIIIRPCISYNSFKKVRKREYACETLDTVTDESTTKEKGVELLFAATRWYYELKM
jgi:hypothetical protein